MGSYLNPRSVMFCNSLRSEIYVDKSLLIEISFACSIGNVSEEMLKKYIENKG